MAHKIIVQDGKVVYTTPDPNNPNNAIMDFTVTGVIRAGNTFDVEGIITTPPDSGIDLKLTTNTDGVKSGNIFIHTEPNGKIILNNIVWPDGTVAPVPGMYLGVSALNTLQFYALPGSLVPINNI